MGRRGASNVRIQGVACRSTRLGSKLGELKGETNLGGGWKLVEVGDTGGDNMFNGLADSGLPQIVLR